MLKWNDIFSYHHKKGSSLPIRLPGVIRLYNMAFCPYGHRVLLVAEAKQIPLEIVNIDLTNSPEWMRTKGFSGVPVLEMDDCTIHDSLEICKFLDDMRESRPLLSIDKAGLERKLAQEFQNVVSCIFPLFFKVFTNEDALPLLRKLTDELVVFNDELESRETAFFGGDKPGYLDYAIWPFVERLVIMKLLFPNAYDIEGAKRRIPVFENWRFNMESDPAVRVSFLGTDDHYKYIQNRRDLSNGLVSEIDYTFVVAD